MGRVVKTVTSTGAAASAAGLTSAEVQTLISNNGDWNLLKRYEITSNISSFNFPAADMDIDNYYGWKFVFANIKRHSSGTDQWYFHTTNNSVLSRVYNSQWLGNNTRNGYLNQGSNISQTDSNLLHVAELWRDNTDHRWQMMWESGMFVEGGYWNYPSWGRVVMWGGEPAAIRNNGMVMQSPLSAGAQGLPFVYLYGSSKNKGST
mgnify:FL=1|tara:strand:+ start:585 stop:1199 length:615 start_codon:yes stop_codon:yes gene_type:complete